MQSHHSMEYVDWSVLANHLARFRLFVKVVLLSHMENPGRPTTSKQTAAFSFSKRSAVSLIDLFNDAASFTAVFVIEMVT